MGGAIYAGGCRDLWCGKSVSALEMTRYMTDPVELVRVARWRFWLRGWADGQFFRDRFIRAGWPSWLATMAGVPLGALSAADVHGHQYTLPGGRVSMVVRPVAGATRWTALTGVPYLAGLVAWTVWVAPVAGLGGGIAVIVFCIVGGICVVTPGLARHQRVAAFAEGPAITHYASSLIRWHGWRGGEAGEGEVFMRALIQRASDEGWVMALDAVNERTRTFYVDCGMRPDRPDAATNRARRKLLVGGVASIRQSPEVDALAR